MFCCGLDLAVSWVVIFGIGRFIIFSVKIMIMF